MFASCFPVALCRVAKDILLDLTEGASGVTGRPPMFPVDYGLFRFLPSRSWPGLG